MRALNQPNVISVLQDEFINCWLLAKDLDEIAKQAKDPDIKKLCQLIKENYKYPVDTVLISSDLSVIGHINVNQTEVMLPKGYHTFLKKRLATIGVQIDTEADTEEPQEPDNAAEMTQESSGTDDAATKPPVGVKLTREQPEGSLLEVVRCDGTTPGMAMYPIDVSDFADGGTVNINVRLGGGDATVQCELCTPDSQNPQFFVTLKTVPGIAPGETKTITCEFEKKQKLMLVVKAMPGSTDQPQTNALLVTASAKTGE